VTGNAFHSHNAIATMKNTTNSETTHDTTTTERVFGGRQCSVDDGEALVYKLNEPSSLITQRYYQLPSHDRQATRDDPMLFIMDGVDSIREVLGTKSIFLGEQEENTGIFDHLDAFVNLSRENETVQEVVLCIPFTDADDDAPGTHRYAIWDKVAEGIGNLQALRKITIVESDSVDGWEGLVPDWEILACILRRLQRGIQLCMEESTIWLWDTETLPFFAGVIHGQAMIAGFSTGQGFYFDCLGILCSALLTLPALDNVQFQHYDGQGPEEGQSLESMIQLLQSPTLREVYFESVVFTNAFSQAVATVLKENSQITDLHFDACSFPSGGSAVIASAIKSNTTLEYLHFFEGADEGFYEV
jgi:hypothetical protein